MSRIGDITTFPEFLREPSFVRNFILGSDFYHYRSHPTCTGKWTGMRTLPFVELLKFEHFREIVTTFLAAVGDSSIKGYHIDLYAEFHSEIEPEAPAIRQANPTADYVGVVCLNEKESSSLLFCSPTDKFNPYNITDEDNFELRDEVPSVFNTLVLFDAKEYYKLSKYQGDSVSTGNLNIVIELTINK